MWSQDTQLEAQLSILTGVGHGQGLLIGGYQTLESHDSIHSQVLTLGPHI